MVMVLFVYAGDVRLTMAIVTGPPPVPSLLPAASPVADDESRNAESGGPVEPSAVGLEPAPHASASSAGTIPIATTSLSIPSLSIRPPLQRLRASLSSIPTQLRRSRRSLLQIRNPDSSGNGAADARNSARTRATS